MKIFGRVLGAFLVIFSLNSCKNGDSGINQSDSANNTSGFKGGNKVARIAEMATPTSIFPHLITQATEALISGQIFEGLVKVDPKTLEVKPGLAEKWELSPDGKTITFQLRKGVKFQKTGIFAEKDVEITAEDVKFTFELLCTYSDNNLHFATVCKDRIVGANECYENSKAGQKIDLKGIKIKDTHSFTIELLNSPAIFLDILGSSAAGILSKEAYLAEKEKTKIGAGPFIYDTKNSTAQINKLYKNEN
ncbi:MAG: hypothetical protein JNM96_07355 [Bacteroidia bacterium]|nr:hypothetical protein [Bacteroidia bacterium]